MGMSASQARFLTLTARKTNTEYEGQQINQQRTALSNESSNYYSQLTSMTVPTPPSSADYSRITYTFVNGTELSTITSLIATADTKNNGIYKLNYTQEFPEDTMVIHDRGQITRESSGKYTVGDVELVQAITTVPDSPSDAQIKDYREHLIKGGIPKEKVSDMTDDAIVAKLRVEAQYNSMMVQKYGNGETGENASTFKVIYRQAADEKSFEPLFYSDNEIELIDYNQETGMSLGGLKRYAFGQSTQVREIKNADAKLEQDSSGRYMSIFIYENYDPTKPADGQPGTKFDLTTNTEADEKGYNDAMNQYFYDKAVYDAKVQEINAKIEIIQVQDKNLELKLKQLDTEQNAIQTEMDAVKKVISKNVESSFKTFSA